MLFRFGLSILSRFRKRLFRNDSPTGMDNFDKEKDGKPPYSLLKMIHTRKRQVVPQSVKSKRICYDNSCTIKRKNNCFKKYNSNEINNNPHGTRQRTVQTCSNQNKQNIP